MLDTERGVCAGSAMFRDNPGSVLGASDRGAGVSVGVGVSSGGASRGGTGLRWMRDEPYSDWAVEILWSCGVLRDVGAGTMVPSEETVGARRDDGARPSDSGTVGAYVDTRCDDGGGPSDSGTVGA